MADRRIVELDALMLGKDIGGGRTIERRVGIGSFSVGYKAVKKKEAPLFVKVPLEQQYHEPLWAVAEKYKTIKGTHPSVATFHDAMKIDGKLPAIMTEYCDIPSVRASISAKRVFTLDETVRAGMRILDGLEFLHGQGIFHSDVSPGNIKVGDDGAVKITDLFHPVFISYFNPDEENVTKYDVNYSQRKHLGYDVDISPPILFKRELKEPNPYTDLFQLATTLNIMLTGRKGRRLPEGNGQENQIRKMQAIIDKGSQELKLHELDDLESLETYERGYHSAQEMRGELRMVLCPEYSVMESYLLNLEKAIREGKRRDGTNNNIGLVNQLYEQLLSLPQEDQAVRGFVERGEAAIREGIGGPLYDAFLKANHDIRKKVNRGWMSEERFKEWHGNRIGAIKKGLEDVKRPTPLNCLLEGYKGREGKGAPFYLLDKGRGTSS